MFSNMLIYRNHRDSLCKYYIRIYLIFKTIYYTRTILYLICFASAQFLEELRSVMGIPEWMLDVDARKTKELHGGACIQMIIHFKGPIAHRLELVR